MEKLTAGQRPVVMNKYPHMMPDDIAVWSEYLKAPVVRILEVWYDVHVGNGLEGVASDDVIGSRISRGIYRKRIDAVCRVPGGYWVVEVKPVGSMTALGQAISYAELFARDYFVKGAIIPIVVCSEVDNDLINTFDHSGVGLIVV